MCNIISCVIGPIRKQKIGISEIKKLKFVCVVSEGGRERHDRVRKRENIAFTSDT